MKKGCFVLIASLMTFAARSQEQVTPDSVFVDTLSEVTVTGFELTRSLFTTSFSVRKLNMNLSDRYNKASLVNGLNTVAGVRMEERSPGSYRINVRGSSLRSPFGVRNIKTYWNGIPVTDPGGNTYFNQFAFNNFTSLEIFKGPAGSLYGAGTGGLILLHSFDNPWRPGLGVEYNRGSFGVNNVFVTARLGGANNRNILTYSHNEQDGYRVQSGVRRDNLSWASSTKLSSRHELTTSVLFTDMYYQTPGGLTKAEFDQDPKRARPAAGGLPGSEQARAAIYQKNLLAGIQHRYSIDSHWANTTSIYLAYAQIKNPAVRNYEKRSEPHAGARTGFSWEKKTDRTALKFVAGGELQEGFFNTKVFQNRQGSPDTLQTDDEIRFSTYSVFIQGDLAISEKWFITAGTSLNKSKVAFTRLNKYPIITQGRTYSAEWAPRISLLRKIALNTSVFAMVSKGFSPPTLAELLPSTGNISTFLEAESGINYEAGIRQRLLGGRFVMELSGYYFRLNNTLVQRRDASGADFFVNAGNTRQKGIEATTDYLKYFYGGNLMERILISGAYTYSHYTYGSFAKDTLDFTGKKLPSVPANTISLTIDTRMHNGLFSNISIYHASRIFLNDANTASAPSYTLLGWKIGWNNKAEKNPGLTIYAGVDNLLDEVYSLGNDINDARGRYYNTAARRNYYGGVVLDMFAKRKSQANSK